MMMSQNRIYKETVNVSQQSVKNFFDKRAPQSIDANINNATMLQDKNPELAKKRDETEKKVITPYLNINKNSRVLDIGCGVGRWAIPFLNQQISSYQGIDIASNLIKIANQLYNHEASFNFKTIDTMDFLQTTNGKFNVVILSGVLNYMNDEDILKFLKEIQNHMLKDSIIYFRVPVSVIQKRLTLKEFWSEELKEYYSSIYRTSKEYENFFEKELSNYTLLLNDFLYKDNLNNREETKQKVYVLKKEN